MLDRLAARLPRLSGAAQEAASAVLARGDLLVERARRVTALRLPMQRQRVHGELRLERLGLHGLEVVVVSFAGEPWCAAGEARLKRSPLRDVASMLLSFSRTADLGAGALGGAPRRRAAPGGVDTCLVAGRARDLPRGLSQRDGRRALPPTGRGRRPHADRSPRLLHGREGGVGGTLRAPPPGGGSADRPCGGPGPPGEERP